MEDLADFADEVVYRAMLDCQPAFVEAVTELIEMGETPEQIEQMMMMAYGPLGANKFGRNQTTRNLRHVANYVARSRAKATP